MKPVVFSIFFWITLFSVQGQTSFFDLADTFFKKYVDQEGQVDYVAIKKNPQLLKDLYTQIEQYDLAAAKPNERKAFYINAYNIVVIKQVVDLYPMEGPLAVEGFFNDIFHYVGGTRLTLDGLEKETLYKEFPDPRLHFVLVCAAKSCPPLAMAAYLPNQLDSQLEDRTKYVLNLPWFILVKEERVLLSQIFNWYKADFGESEENLLKYVNSYRMREIKSKDVGYYEYDWKLNIKEK